VFPSEVPPFLQLIWELLAIGVAEVKTIKELIRERDLREMNILKVVETWFGS